jgi:DNA-directed RNA polymerase subunit RPC12/RpoP
MDDIKEYFLCDACQNKDFTKIYNFSMIFYTVNFSDDLVYERLAEESYQCTRCSKIFTQKNIEKSLNSFKKLRKARG